MNEHLARLYECIHIYLQIFKHIRVVARMQVERPGQLLLVIIYSYIYT